ncbi:MAG: polymer-forming cytoskeletal protein [Desulfobacterales bacterium]|nr:polymer-forming cytoskeletal protein [Desulfobacterales bacterium]
MKNEKKIESISTFIGFGSGIEGNVEFQGTMRLDGRVNGKITSKNGTLIVGEKAVIEADILVESIIIMGTVSGTIDAQKRIEVRPPGQLNGSIQAGVISIEPGGRFNGKCAMRTKLDALKKPLSAPPNPARSELSQDP